MTTTSTERRVLSDAARVLAAHRELRPVLERFARTPLDRTAAGELRRWLDGSYPSAAAALDRLKASGAGASPPSRARARGGVRSVRRSS